MSLLHRLLALEAAVPFEEVAHTWPVRRQAWADAAVDAQSKRSSPALAKLLAELLALFTPDAVKLYWRKKADHTATIKATRAIANNLASDPRGEALHNLLNRLYDRIMPKPSKADLKLMSNGKPDHYLLDSDAPTFNKNERCEALDLRSAWCPAVVIGSRRELDTSMHYHVKYDGWGAKWNDWIPQDSGRLRKPVTQGAAGQPPSKQGEASAAASSKKGLKIAAKPAASTAPVGARSVKSAGKVTATGRRIAEQAMLAQQQAEAALAKEPREAAGAASPPLPPPVAPGPFPTVIRFKSMPDLVVPSQKKRPLPPAAAQDEPARQVARRKEPAAAPQDMPTAAPLYEPTAAPQDEPTATPEDEPAAAPQDEPAAAPQHEPAAAPQDEPIAAPQGKPAATPHDEPEVSHRVTSAGVRRASELRLSSLPIGRRRVWLARLQLMREHLKRLSSDATMFSAAKGFILRYNKGLQEYVYEMAQVEELDGRVLQVRVLNTAPVGDGSEKAPLVRTQVAYVSNSKASEKELDSLVASLEAGTMADLPLQKVIDMLRILAIRLPPTMRKEDEPFLRVAAETMDALAHNRPLPDIPPTRRIPQAGNFSLARKTQDSPSASGAVFSSGRVPDTFQRVPLEISTSVHEAASMRQQRAQQNLGGYAWHADSRWNGRPLIFPAPPSAEVSVLKPTT